jgi:hypothetical protein
MSKKFKIFAIVSVFIIFSVASVIHITADSEYDSVEELRWSGSGHADETSESFRHWDEDDPPLVPTSCARCHSTGGFLDFVGADGSNPGTVDNAAQPEVITCQVCHQNDGNGATRDLGSVTFPSGATVDGLGPEAICMQCHQGRASSDSVEGSIAGAGVATDDEVSANLGFINIHYFAAAATQFGTLARGGYQYAGKAYDGRFAHLTGYNACNTCHDPHSLKINPERCHTCHTNVESEEDYHAIRYYGSLTDYDGDGDISEGIYYEVKSFEDKLYAAMQDYATNVIGTGIVYDAHTYPYFFTDTNGNGTADESEANYGNRYTTWSARLLRAAYNYQVSKKDPGGFAHGGKYMIQLLYDSIENVNQALANPLVKLGKLKRDDEGHYDGSTEAWRHWDGDGEVSGSCARCHSAEGLPYFLENGEDMEAAAISNGLLCTTCHSSPPRLRSTAPVTFPSGVTVDMGDSSNLCLHCHQGRASRYSVDSTIASGPGPYGFTNIHYYPTAAVLFGSVTRGGYEYPGKVYRGQKTFANHAGRFDTCVECHMGTEGADFESAHNVARVNPADCVYCHGQDVAQPNPGADPAGFKFSGIRPASIPDYDGDGNTAESIKDEIQGLEAALYARIQAYAFSIGKPIIYDAHAYPYFFNDSNGNGLVDPGEAIYPNAYKFNAKLLKAAYNYQLSLKEPNGYIHNSRYIAQLLVDSIQNLGGSVAPYWWR